MAEQINTNTQVVTNFKMVISDSDFDYFIQNAELPSVSLSSIETPWQNFGGFMPDNKIVYDPLNISFLLAEDMKNYLFIFDWLKRVSDKGRLKDQFRDVTLHILSNNKTTNQAIKFVNSFPTNISQVSFDSGSGDASPIIVQATIAYQFFEFI